MDISEARAEVFIALEEYLEDDFDGADVTDDTVISEVVSGFDESDLFNLYGILEDKIDLPPGVPISPNMTVTPNEAETMTIGRLASMVLEASKLEEPAPQEERTL